MVDFVAALQSGKPLLMDGAMGTELRKLGEFDCCEQFNLDAPAKVQAIHRAYLGAGAKVLLTNTFQANPHALARCKCASEHRNIWKTAIRLAHLRMRRPLFVLADVGPIADLTPKIASDVWKEIRGVDGVLLETWSSTDALRTFTDSPSRKEAPMLVSFTYQRKRRGGLRTFEDIAPAVCARTAKKCGAIAIGANCGNEINMTDMLDLVRRYNDAVDLPVFVRPNAGTPRLTPNGWQYPRSPEEMAEGIGPLLEEGIAMLGGCCGVGPAHIARFRKAITSFLRSA